MIELCLDQASQIYGIYNLFSRQAAVIETHLVQSSRIYGYNGHISKGILVDEFCLDVMYFCDWDASSQIYGLNTDFSRQISEDELCLDYWYDRDTLSQIYSFNGNFLRGTAAYKLCLNEVSQIYGWVMSRLVVWSRPFVLNLQSPHSCDQALSWSGISNLRYLQLIFETGSSDQDAFGASISNLRFQRSYF